MLAGVPAVTHCAHTLDLPFVLPPLSPVVIAAAHTPRHPTADSVAPGIIMLLGPMVLRCMVACRALLRPSPRMLTMSAGAAGGRTTRLPGDLLVREHTLSVPLDHKSPRGSQLSLFVRELVPASKASDSSLPCVLYLQGGPGFPSGRPTSPPGGWQKAALDTPFRILLLDQRGTGRSTPVSKQSLSAIEGGPAGQAAYLEHFRADSIVRDCEVVRKSLAGGSKVSLLGQSFGGFCILSYLSLFPESIERALFTFGLAPVGQKAEDVYRATFKRMEERNRRFYERYPQDIELVRTLVRELHENPASLPRGGTLTPRRFLMVGLLLGSASGFESLHDLLEMSIPRCGDGGGSATLPDDFLLAIESAQQGFETNPIYWLLHESIYCDGPAMGASEWAAERVQAELGESWDYATRLEAGDEPINLSGEMVYSWMGEDFAWLRPLKPTADILAAKADWGPLYDAKMLRSPKCPPVAALVSYEDIYVERDFSERTARMLGPEGGGTARLWITNEFQHSGLRDQPAVVFERLMKMAKGDIAIPS